MRLAFVVHDLEMGGLQFSVEKILSGLAAERHLLVLSGKPSRALLEHVHVHYPAAAPSTQGRLSLIGRWRHCIHWLRQRLQSIAPEAVLAFGFTPICLSVLATWSAGLPTPVVACLRISLMELTLSKSFLSPLRWLFPVLLRHAKLVVPVSQGIAAEVAALGIPKRRIHVIQNGYDFEEIRRRAREVPDGGTVLEDSGVPVIVTTGRLAHLKNHELLLEAFALARQRTLCRLLIIGDGPRKEFLESRARELGVARDVTFVGALANPHALVSRAKVFALTSHCEGFPNVLCESMICGTAVVSVDCPTGPSEILAQGRLGLLSPPGDAVRLAENLVLALTDPGLRSELADRARASIENYSVARMVAEYERACWGLLASDRLRPRTSTTKC